MNYLEFSVNDWLHFLENRHSEEIQLGLDRVKVIADSLNLLQFDSKVVTIAGTNGKGSTVAALASIYCTAGYQVASYTSPHLLTFNERICINRQPISDADLCAAFVKIEQSLNDLHLTYFEMTTLAALWYFKQFKLDVILLEVGMGGRLDATNIIDSDLAIITTVDLDHQAYLGSTKEAIGYEKAGILRPAQAYIYADTEPPPLSVTQMGQVLNAKRLMYSFKITPTELQLLPLSESSITVPLPRLHSNAAAAALMASTYFKATLPVTLSQYEEAMKKVCISGRQQVVKGKVTKVFDVAHNPQAVQALADTIKRTGYKGKVHAVFSGLKDKDLCGLIKPMHTLVDIWYPAILDSKRAASQALLLSVLQAENCCIMACFENPMAAYQKAMERAVVGDVIVVYGSFLTVSAVMVANQTEQEEVL